MVTQNIGNGLRTGLPVNGAVGTALPVLAPGTAFVAVPTPSNSAGLMTAAAAAFGAEVTTSGVSGSIVLVTDGATATNACAPLVGFPAGAIALVDRGTCTFVEKAANVQAAGGIGMIVTNNVAGNPIAMGGTGPGITIPAVMVSQASGLALRSPGTANGTLRRAQ
jgi:hypothetical protein